MNTIYTFSGYSTRYDFVHNGPLPPSTNPRAHKEWYAFLYGYMTSVFFIHCKNEWDILTLIWLHEFQFLPRLYKSMLLSCLYS